MNTEQSQQIIDDIIAVSTINYAATVDFDILYQELSQLVEQGFVTTSDHPTFPLRIYKYSHKCVCEKYWNKYTLIARGLVLDIENKKVVAIPFPKFFNYDEVQGQTALFCSKFLATEKLDGSLGIIFSYNNQWIGATAGSFISEQAQWANRWLQQRDLSVLSPDNTYLAEIIYAENRIVVKYDTEGLFLLSGYTSKGIELDRETLENIAKDSDFGICKVYNYDDIRGMVEEAKELDHNHEGYVIRFDNGCRIKIKGDPYCRLHRLISGVTPLNVWRDIRDKEPPPDISELPEEIRRDYNNIYNIIISEMHHVSDEIEICRQKVSHLKTRKDIALFLQNRYERFHDLKYPDARKYIFLVIDGKFEKEFNEAGSKIRRDVFVLFRPDNNVLPGFVPSTIMNRFREEDSNS